MSKLKTTFIFLIIFFAVFVLARSAWASTYYVSPVGSAAWPQCANINLPCSVQAAMQNAAAGDEVYFRGGIYTISEPVTTGALKPVNNGTSQTSQIIFQNYPGEVPILERGTDNLSANSTYFVWTKNGTFDEYYVSASGQGYEATIVLENDTPMARGGAPGTLAEGQWTNSGGFLYVRLSAGAPNRNPQMNQAGYLKAYSINHIIWFSGKKWIIFDGFQIGNGNNKQGGMLVNDLSSNITIKNCVFKGAVNDSGGYGGNQALLYLSNSSDSIVTNCDFSGLRDITTDHAQGILMYYDNGITIEKCTFHDIGGMGIHAKSGDINHIYRFNFFYDLFVYNDGDKYIPSGFKYGENCIGINKWAGPPAPTNIKIYQNVILVRTPSNAISGELNIYDANIGDNIEIYNNSIYGVTDGTEKAFYQNRQGGIKIDNFTNVKIWNNIFGNLGTYTYWEPFHYFFLGNGTNDDNDARPFFADYNIFDGSTFWKVRQGGTNPQTYSTLSAWQVSGELVGGGNPDVNSYFENPQFLNPGGISPADYNINSLHKNSGRGGTYASIIGAYIAGSEQIGYVATNQVSDTTPPQAPSGVTVY